MTNETRIKPQLRFEPFEDSWSKLNLNEVSERVKRKNKNLESLMPLTISGKYGLVDQITYFSKSVSAKNLENYTLIKNGEFAYNKSYSNGYPLGAIKRLDKYEKGALSTLYICFKVNEKNNSNFIKYFFETTKWHKEVSSISVEGARNHGLLNISVNDFFNIKISLPSVEEQQKIGFFFSKLDRQIELEEQKLEKLEEQKKGYMQKLFSQELRFKDDSGCDYPNWKYNYLGNYMISHDEKTTENNQYPVLTSSREGLFLQKDYFTRDVASKDNTGYNVVPYGYFTYRHMSDDLVFKFNINYIVQKGIVSTLYPVFKTTSDLDNYFLKEILNNGNEFKKYALMQKQGGSRTYMYFSKLKQLKLHIPVLKEQEKISVLLKNLDSLIEKQSSKVELLKQRKLGFLQKMFI